jgi:hypothetical protein
MLSTTCLQRFEAHSESVKHLLPAAPPSGLTPELLPLEDVDPVEPLPVDAELVLVPELEATLELAEDVELL